MSSTLSKIAPVGFRLARANKATWTKTASRTFGSIIAQNIATPTTASYKNQRTFSSNAPPSLAECLSTEIQSELAEDEIDHEFLDAKKQTEKLFEICDLKGEGIVTLKRTFNGEAVEVTFDCQDEAEMDMDDMNEPENEDAPMSEDDDEDGPTMEYGINFDVTIAKASGEKIVVNCVASRKLIVRSVRHLDSGKEVADAGSYAGPVFEQLNTELQDGFYTFLGDRGIDDDLCFFVLSYSRVKEQAEYSNWLNKCLNFVEK